MLKIQTRLLKDDCFCQNPYGHPMYWRSFRWMMVRRYDGRWTIRACCLKVSELGMVVGGDLPVPERTESLRIHRHQIVMLTVSEVVAQVLVSVTAVG